jgi:hypothetical protein
MPISRIPPTQGQLDGCFGPPSVFEFALGLGGTVSAGANTAGAVDFLIGALDCLSKAQQEGRAPRYKVRLALIAGTSGGGVNAAIAAPASAYESPHVAHSTSIGINGSGNPFYDIMRFGLMAFSTPAISAPSLSRCFVRCKVGRGVNG